MKYKVTTWRDVAEFKTVVTVWDEDRDYIQTEVDDDLLMHVLTPRWIQTDVDALIRESKALLANKALQVPAVN